MIAAGALAEVFAALPLVVEEVRFLVRGVSVPSYPGGVRPSGILELLGEGERGSGECVAWSLDAQASYGAALSASLSPGRWLVADIARAVAAADPYARAAAEAAAIDLALRQAQRSIASLTEVDGLHAVDIACAISFDACPDPALRIAALLSLHPAARFKIDVDPTWSALTIESLRSQNRIAVVDFKDRGDPDLVERIAAHLPHALLEDPPSTAGIPPARIARDASIRSAKDVHRIAAASAINIKAPRMGGFLEALRGIEAAREAGARVYLGGMFEVGVGRRQARVLAALFSARAQNDLAPLFDDERRDWPGGTVRVDLRAPGFGA